ncbi:MAG: ABC transporter ATP-binding protein [Bacteroidales bacterium]|nr:ABC transporter ATP-binding protein [Bacteroidales bacterium]
MADKFPRSPTCQRDFQRAGLRRGELLFIIMNSGYGIEIAIKAQNLTKQFGDFTAVDNLSLEIPRNKIFGFLGPNGAGKTTTINMVCGISQPTAGEVHILGKRIKDNETLKGKIGICPQENIFWPKLTCHEQLVFMGEMYGLKRSVAIMRSVGLLELLGLIEKRNILASKLSGGMKRRLSICLALVHDPEIIVLDEPEAGLDPQSRILVRNFIKSLADKKTVLLTTHNMDEADRLADLVAIIDHGKLLMLETPGILKRSIGEGDLLEIVFEEIKEDEMKPVRTELEDICNKIIISGNSLILKSKNIVGLIPEITTRIKKQNLNIHEIKLRENTLEDVFIHLTGRKLRQ